MITQAERKELRRRIHDLVEARSEFDHLTDALMAAIPGIFDERWNKLKNTSVAVFSYIDTLTEK